MPKITQFDITLYFCKNKVILKKLLLQNFSISQHIVQCVRGDWTSGGQKKWQV